MREITETICSGIQPLQNLVVLQKIGDEGKMEWGRFWIDKGFKGKFKNTYLTRKGTNNERILVVKYGAPNEELLQLFKSDQVNLFNQLPWYRGKN